MILNKSKIEYRIERKKIDKNEWIHHWRYPKNSSQQIFKRYINKLLLPLDQLNNQYISVYNSDELEKRKFLQSNFLTITDNSLELTSLLYHIYYSNSFSSENLHYIRYIVPNCNNELGLIWTIKLEWERKDRVWNNHLIRSFDNPNFSEYIYNTLCEFMSDDFVFKKEMKKNYRSDDSYWETEKDSQELNHFVEFSIQYLMFCSEQKKFDNKRMKKIFNDLSLKFSEYNFTYYFPSFWNHHDVSEDMNIKVHLRDLTLYRSYDCKIKDGFEHEEVQLYDGMYIHDIKPFPSRIHSLLLDERKKRSKKRWREYEQEIRVELGIPKIGEQWVSETSVYYLVKKILSQTDIEVLHHYRPKFLEGKELDIYFEYCDKKVGIEYQGLQHFKPVDFFGGEKSFKEVQKRDKDKKNQCEKNGIELIYYNHFENISEKLVIKKLKDVIPSFFD